MIDLKQLVKMSWSPFNRKRFEDLGYQYKYRGTFYVKAEELSFGSDRIVKAVCDYCGKTVDVEYQGYIKSTHNFEEKYACHECKSIKAHEKRYNPKKYYDRYLEACKEKGFEPLTDFSDFDGCRDGKVKIWCPKHGEQIATYYYVVDGIGCRDCSNEIYTRWNQLSQDDVNKILKEKGVEWLNYGEYKNRDEKNLLVVCPICNNQYIASFASLNNNSGNCKQCASKLIGIGMRLPINEVIQRIEGSGKNKLLNPEDYRSNEEYNLDISCPCGGHFYTSLTYFEKGKNRCDLCTSRKSNGEVLVEDILMRHNISFDYQHRFPDCKDKNVLPFDFYLEKYNACIEFDGQGHFEPMFGQESFEKTVKHDKMKNEYCEKNGIQLLRIPFWESNNAELMISNFLYLTKFPKIIHYYKNPYKNEE